MKKIALLAFLAFSQVTSAAIFEKPSAEAENQKDHTLENLLLENVTPELIAAINSDSVTSMYERHPFEGKYGVGILGKDGERGASIIIEQSLDECRWVHSNSIIFPVAIEGEDLLFVARAIEKDDGSGDFSTFNTDAFVDPDNSQEGIRGKTEQTKFKRVEGGLKVVEEGNEEVMLPTHVLTFHEGEKLSEVQINKGNLDFSFQKYSEDTDDNVVTMKVTVTPIKLPKLTNELLIVKTTTEGLKNSKNVFISTEKFLTTRGSVVLASFYEDADSVAVGVIQELNIGQIPSECK